MKVLIISNNEDKINKIDSFMKANNYDVIVYKWLLKALDNIEEIKPDVIFISATEFPRHWKTLASFVQSGIGGKNVRLFLYEQQPLPEDELDKAKALGIEACLSSLENDVLKEYFSPIENQNNNEKSFLPAEILITGPNYEGILSGSIIEKKEDILTCKIANFNIEKGTLLDEISICSNDDILYLSAEVIDSNVEKNIVTLSVCDYYEEK